MGVFFASCAVYDTELVSSNGGLTGGGTTTSGGSSNDAGTATSTSGKTGDGGKGASGEAGTSANGGTGTEPQGGAPSEAGEDAGGAAGTPTMGGSAGNAGQGGNAGTNAGTGGSNGGGGNGGAGGTAPVAKCSDHPLTAKPTWKATASSESLGNGTEADGLYNPAVHMTDGSYSERWSSGKTQLGDEWIQIDFGAVVSLTAFTLNVNNDPGDYPRAYELRVSNTSGDFEATVRASGEGMPGNTAMTFPMVSGRYVTVRQTGMNTETTSWWTVAEVFAVCSGS